MSENADSTIHLTEQKKFEVFCPSDRFEIKGSIGQGGMATVFLAHEPALERDVAIKVLPGQALHDEDSKARFLREARALGQLDHPNIVKILSSGVSTEGLPYYVMELLDGRTLSAELNELGSLSLARFYQIIKQVIAGLQQAHARNIVHRDLKPSNIIICNMADHTTSVKIIDFGIARITEGEEKGSTITLTNAVIGSPSYMSPEQCASSELDHRSD